MDSPHLRENGDSRQGGDTKAARTRELDWQHQPVIDSFVVNRAQ